MPREPQYHLFSRQLRGMIMINDPRKWVQSTRKWDRRHLIKSFLCQLRQISVIPHKVNNETKYNLGKMIYGYKML